MTSEETDNTSHQPGNRHLEAQAGHTYLALHTLGWKAFQDLCAQICEVVLNRTVSIYREAQDGGQDATFTTPAQTKRSLYSGTIQCKFVSDPYRRMRVSDITDEEEHIRSLSSAGLAHSYIFMTNMGVDAPIAAEIKSWLQSLGVIEPDIYGKEWITLKVRESTRLRALVPRIYGLGDLSSILDERRAEQTEALLGHLLPALRSYVPTSAHRQAVRLLAENGIVLLTGAPATGKSMIAAILATTTLGSGGHNCFQFDGPSQLVEHWNPNESGRFYWIDDAFGPTQIRDDYVDHWIGIMNKVKAAIASGNRFVLTSRQHIWNAAKPRLGMRNHSKLADETSVVNVSALSPDERAQILYNHIKAGNQSQGFRAALKPHLEKIVRENELLPEIARRLGDRAYTSAIRRLPEDVVRFVAEPKEFLIETLQELTDAQQAALTAVFLFRARLPSHIATDRRIGLACDKFGVQVRDLMQALVQLDGSFVLKKSAGAEGKIWTFVHPTITDALAEILRTRPDLLEIYIHGARSEVVLAEVSCDGISSPQGALIVPDSFNETLVERVLEMRDERESNQVLFAFLARRASEAVIRAAMSRNPDLIKRDADSYARSRFDDKVRLAAKLHAMRILEEDDRDDIALHLERALFEMRDASFLDDEDILPLFSPTRLINLAGKLQEKFRPIARQWISQILEDPDRSEDAADNFHELQSYLRSIGNAFSEVESVDHRINKLQESIHTAVKEIEKLGRKERVVWSGRDEAPKIIQVANQGRSLFSDIDS